MGYVYADITLANATDAGMARRGKLKDKDVRQMTVSALVDSGAYLLTINESIKRQLDLDVWETREVELANGSHHVCEMVGPINLHFENRMTSCLALVLPGANEVLMGSIPLEDLDVLIDPKAQKLIVHPDRPYIAGTKVK